MTTETSSIATVEESTSLISAERAHILSLPITWKCEGPTDLLSIKSLMHFLPDNHNHDAWTTPYGAGENLLGEDCYRVSKAWLLEELRGQIVYVVHDADVPGQNGAKYTERLNASRRPGWAPCAAKYAEEVRNVVPPYEIEESHGKDLRDWIGDLLDKHRAAGLDEHTARVEAYFDLCTYARENGELFERPSSDQVVEVATDEDGNESYILEEIDDPHRLARINLQRYKSVHGRELRYWNEQWFVWKSGRYIAVSDDYMESRINGAIKQEFDRVWVEESQQYNDWKNSDKYDPDRDKGEPKARRVTTSITRNVRQATKAICIVPSSVKMPCWLTDRSEPNLLAMNNGLLNLDTLIANMESKNPDRNIAGKLLEKHSPNWFSTFILDYDYIPNAYPTRWIEYLTEAMEGDKERIDILQEWAGYLLTSTNDLQKFLCLEGDGGNGKTVFFAGIEAMLGTQNVSHVPIENFGGRFDLGSTLGKAANIAGDVGELDAVAEGILKQFTGGDPMHFDRKGIDPISAVPTAKLMCAWNNRPRFRDRSGGLWRRMILVPFNYKVPKERRVFGMDSRYWWIEKNEVAGILNWAIAGLARLRANGCQFTEPLISVAAAEEYRVESNPAGEFLSDMLIESEPASDNDDHITLSLDIYGAYEKWSRQLGMHPLGSRQFFRELNKKFPRSERRRSNASGRPWGYIGVRMISDDIPD